MAEKRNPSVTPQSGATAPLAGEPKRKGFDLGDVLAGVLPVSESDTREQIVYLDINLIDPDKNNFYSLDGIDELAANIELVGLQQPLRVRENPDMPGRYLTVSGHRRRAALWTLYEEAPEKWGRVACIIEKNTGSAALQELRLIYANANTREMTSADISKQAERVERLLYQLKEEGYEFPGRMRDHVAEACKVSKTKLATLKVIRENLAPAWKPAYEKGSLAESTAYALARQPLWIQQAMNRVCKTPMSAAVERIGAIMQAGNDYKCETLTGPGCQKCTHGDAFLRHDLEDYCYPCKGKTCCLKCDKASRDWYPCDRMCSKAKARRSSENAKAKERKETAEQLKKKQLLADLAASAARLLKAADAAGVSDDTELPDCRGRYYSLRTVGFCRKAAAGEDVGSVYENDLLPTRLDVAAVAKALHCSADYICGLTDELHPSGGPSGTPAPAEDAGDEPPVHGAENCGRLPCPQFRSGTPDHDCVCWCVFEVDGAGSSCQPALLRDGKWRFYGINATIDAECVGWIELPDYEGVLRK